MPVWLKLRKHHLVSQKEISSNDDVSHDNDKERAAHRYWSHDQAVHQGLSMISLVIQEITYAPPDCEHFHGFP